MSTEKSLSQRWQYAAYVGLVLVALATTVVLLPASSTDFQRFLGDANPIWIVLASAAAGAVALAYLRQAGGFEILKGRATLRGIAFSALLATLLASAVIVADIVLRYPADVNVPWPEALLFYPAIGFVAEILFHVVPLALLMLLLSPLSRRLGSERLVWTSIFCVAILEPIFQVVFDSTPIDLLDVYTFVHVFAIAFLQLWVFRRYDFCSMYLFRLIYYAYWHVLWGVLRLELLF